MEWRKKKGLEQTQWNFSVGHSNTVLQQRLDWSLDVLLNIVAINLGIREQWYKNTLDIYGPERTLSIGSCTCDLLETSIYEIVVFEGIRLLKTEAKSVLLGEP